MLYVRDRASKGSRKDQRHKENSNEKYKVIVPCVLRSVLWVGGWVDGWRWQVAQQAFLDLVPNNSNGTAGENNGL